MSKRISKMLFSKERVELSSMKQIKEAISNMKDMENDATKVADQYLDAMSKAETVYKKVLSERNAIYSWTMSEAPARIQDFKSAAKELGIDVSKISEVQQLEKLIQVGKELIKVMDKVKRPDAGI
jgi:L-rhamnose isomerase